MTVNYTPETTMQTQGGGLLGESYCIHICLTLFNTEFCLLFCSQIMILLRSVSHFFSDTAVSLPCLLFSNKAD